MTRLLPSRIVACILVLALGASPASADPPKPGPTATSATAESAPAERGQTSQQSSLSSGKRSTVQDAHDKLANLEVDHLSQTATAESKPDITPCDTCRHHSKTKSSDRQQKQVLDFVKQ